MKKLLPILVLCAAVSPAVAHPVTTQPSNPVFNKVIDLLHEDIVLTEGVLWTSAPVSTAPYTSFAIWPRGYGAGEAVCDVEWRLSTADPFVPAQINDNTQRTSCGINADGTFMSYAHPVNGTEVRVRCVGVGAAEVTLTEVKILLRRE